MKIAVLYHRADLDGVLSGVIAKFYLGHRHDDVKVFGCDYHDNLKEETLKEFDQIYVIDFSHDVLLLTELANKVIWIDHHKSAIEKYKESKARRFCIDGVAACRLALQYFTGVNYAFTEKRDYVDRKVIEPLMVTLAGEYDIWDETSPCARPFNFGIADISFENIWRIFLATKSILCNCPKHQDESILEELNEARQIDGWESKILYNCIIKGRGAVDYISSISNRCPKVNVNINGKKGRVFNTSVFSSLIHSLEKDEDFTMVWSHLESDKVKVSFYSDKINVYEIAQQYGGGGHRGAAGCTVNFPILFSILANK